MKIFILSIINNPSGKLSDTVVSSLLGHKAHAMFIAGLGEVAHFGPLVCIGIIDQHFSKTVTTVSSCNDAALL